MCKSRKRKQLEVHHIMTWADAGTLRFDPDNGITLCKSCHKEITGKEVHFQQVFLSMAKKNGKKT
jgi:hypothetical protein